MRCFRRKTSHWLTSHLRSKQKSSKNGYRPEAKNLSLTVTTEGLSYIKLTNWIFTEWWKKYESGLCHWMANRQEIWWKGKSLVFALMIRTGGECSVLFPLSCCDTAQSVNSNIIILTSLLVVMLEFVKDLAYVINLGAHLLTSKQTNRCPMYRRFKVLRNPVMLQWLTSRRRRVSRCERVFWWVSSKAAWLALTLTWGL